MRITFTIRAATADYLDGQIEVAAVAFFRAIPYRRVQCVGTDRDGLGQYLFTVTVESLD